MTDYEKIKRYVSELLTLSGINLEGESAAGTLLFHAYVAVAMFELMDADERALVKGIRCDADLRDEYAQYEFNSQRCPGIETVLLPASPGLTGVSSTAVRELILSGSDTSAFLAPEAAVKTMRDMVRKMYVLYP
jgi:phosphopantetheine adenylyltransferase